jgi:tellurite resistance protein
MLSMFKDKLSANKNRMNGNTDLLEAVCAAAALVAAADGDIDDSEVEATVGAVKANHVLADAFKAREVETCINKMLDRAGGGRTGRMGLYKEIRDVAGKEKEDRELVLLTALDIADADGNLDDAEKKVLDKIAGELSLKIADYDI